MSQYSRNERNANAGIVVAINPETDFPGRTARGRCVTGSAGIQGLCTGRQRLLRARPAGRRLLRGVAVHPVRRGRSFVYSRACGWAICRRHCRHTPSTPFAKRCLHSASRSAVSIATTPCSPASRAALRRRCALRVTRVAAESERARPVPLRRRRGLCGRHPLGGCRWHQGGGSGRTESLMKFEDIKKLHQKKFREEFGLLPGGRRASGAGAAEGGGARCAAARQRDLSHAGV